MDAYIVKVQNWLNGTYGSDSRFEMLPVTGETGWTTIYGLTRALQIELGIQQTADNFGPSTRSLFESTYGVIQRQPDGADPTNVNKIIQGALWCKGYDFGSSELTGNFYSGTEDAIKELESDAGLANPTGKVDVDMMAALLSMKQYKLVSGGDSRIRTIQRYLNRNYPGYVTLLPCDGVIDRDTSNGFIVCYQAAEGYSIADATGNFGSGTLSNSPTLPSTSLSADKVREFTILLQYALYMYDPERFEDIVFNGVLDDHTMIAVGAFCSYVGLPFNAQVTPSVWAALMVSYGDITRSVTAFDRSDPLTESQAAILAQAGFEYVGRYLYGSATKKLSMKEAIMLLRNGLKIVPIFQTTSNRADYFSKSRGVRDAQLAYKSMNDLQLPMSTTIYFAADFDIYPDEVVSNLIPYFQGVNETLDELTDGNYSVGIYAPRYACTLVSNQNLASKSYVADMSSGYVCNIGHPLPDNWAFDQFYETTYNGINIDKVATSSRASGITELAQYTSTTGKAEEKLVRDVLQTFMGYDVVVGLSVGFETTGTIYEDAFTRISYIASIKENLTGMESDASFTITNGGISASAQAEFNDLQVKLNAPIGELLFGNLANLAFVIQDGEMGCSVKSTSEGIQISVTAKILGNRDDILDNVYVGLSILIKKQDDGSTLLDYESYAECYDFFVKVASQPEEDLKNIMVYAFIGILGLTGAYAGLDIIGLITGFYPELGALIPIIA